MASLIVWSLSWHWQWLACVHGGEWFFEFLPDQSSSSSSSWKVRSLSLMDISFSFCFTHVWIPLRLRYILVFCYYIAHHWTSSNSFLSFSVPELGLRHCWLDLLFWISGDFNQGSSRLCSNLEACLGESPFTSSSGLLQKKFFLWLYYAGPNYYTQQCLEATSSSLLYELPARDCLFLLWGRQVGSLLQST